MKTFLPHQQPQPTRDSFVFRRRVRSVRTTIHRQPDQMPEEEAIMNRLERGLERELDKEEWQPAEPSLLLPDSDAIRIENKLWRYFVARMELVREKVEKERLNVCERELQAIKEQVLSKRASNNGHITKAEAKIQAKHREIHALFEEIKHERIAQENAANLMKAKKRRAQEAAQSNNPEKISKIKERIEAIRSEISKSQQELQHCQGELFKVEEEWKSFLRHFLKEGYYFQDGAAGILKEMVEAGYCPSLDDFPPFLDHTSRQCLLAEYHRLKGQAVSPHSLKSFSKSEQVSESRRHMRQLATRDSLQKIYEGTRDYMTDWLKNEGWKREVNLPRIQSTKSTADKPSDWRADEKKRLLFIDDKERYRKVKAVLFGSKVETLA